MPLVHNGTSWVSSKPYVKNGGVWTQAKEAWVNKQGVWQREYVDEVYRIEGRYWQSAAMWIAIGNSSYESSPPYTRIGSFTGALDPLSLPLAISQRDPIEYPWNSLFTLQGDQTVALAGITKFDIGDGIERPLDRIAYIEEKMMGWVTVVQINQTHANSLFGLLSVRLGQNGYFRLIPP